MAITPNPVANSGAGQNMGTSKIDTINFTGDNVKDTFIIPHGLGLVPRYANTIAKNPNAIGDISVVWDATNITVMFSVPPAPGTITLTWIAVI